MTYYHNKINNCSDSCTLFKTFSSLSSSPLPPPSSTLKVLAHWFRNFRMRFFIFFSWHFYDIFSYSSSFPNKMLAMHAKTQKIKPDPIFFITDESFGGGDWHNVRSYLFFNSQKFQTRISDSVCKNLYSCQLCYILHKYNKNKQQPIRLPCSQLLKP